MSATQSVVLSRQTPLRGAYKAQPEKAMITKHVRTSCPPGTDPLHGVVVPGDDYGVEWRYGIDRAVGGLHDAPNPGEILCAALAACQDSTLRMVAELMGVALLQTEVEVTGQVDVRGCLAIDRETPIGFQVMECKVRVQIAPDTPAEKVKKLFAQSEQLCINLATLRQGVRVQSQFSLKQPVEAG